MVEPASRPVSSEREKSHRLIFTDSSTSGRQNFCVSLASSARCTCPETIQGDFCQYTTPKLIQNLPPIEYRQFDRDALAGIAGLGSASANNHPSHLRGTKYAITLGNRSKFVFCLTNPCENGGTCFVTNTATTKV